MFNVRPNLRVPGFNVREPEEEVPGFRLNADGTIGKPPTTAAKPNGNPFGIFEPQPSGVWPPPTWRWRSWRHGRQRRLRGAFLDDIKELPEAIGDRVGAMAKGAYSIGPGVTTQVVLLREGWDFSVRRKPSGSVGRSS